MNRLAASRALRHTSPRTLALRSTLTRASTRLSSTASVVPESIPPVQLPLRFHDKHTAITHFSQVRGVGRKTANEWASAGCESLDDVLAKDACENTPLSLTDYQRENIRGWTDYLARVPVRELAALEVRAKEIAHRVDAQLEASVSAIASEGAYSSYKLELALQHPTASGPSAALLLKAFVQKLHHAEIANSKWWSQTRLAGLRWEGFVVLPGDASNARQICITIEQAPHEGGEVETLS